MLIMPKKILEEAKQRATRLVLDPVDEYPNLTPAHVVFAPRRGFVAESQRRRVRQAQIDSGESGE